MDTKKLISDAFDVVKGSILQDPDELFVLLKLLESSKPQTMIEIGTGKGGSTLIWSKVFGEFRTDNTNPLILTVNTPEGPPAWDFKTSVLIPIKQVYGYSNEVVDQVKKELEDRKIEKVDFLFIDGDHWVDSVRSDFLNYGSLVKSNGLIAFHDVNINDANGPGGFWNSQEWVDTCSEVGLIQGRMGMGILRRRFCCER